MKILRCAAATTPADLFELGVAESDLLAVADVRVVQVQGAAGHLASCQEPIQEVLVYLRAGAYVPPKIQSLVLDQPPH